MKLLRVGQPFVILFAIAAAFTACSAGEHMTTARAGVQQFRDQMAQGQYAAIYAAAEPEMKNSGPQEEVVQFLSGLSAKLGTHKSSRQVGWHVNYGTGGTIVTLRYDSTFERGKGAEEFVFRVRDGVAHLVGYHITSNALLNDSTMTV